MKKWALISVLFAVSAAAQTSNFKNACFGDGSASPAGNCLQASGVVGINYSGIFAPLGTIDASGAVHTFSVKSGTVAALPATCTFTAGAKVEMYVATDAAAGQNLYFCTATNTWTQSTVANVVIKTATNTYTGGIQDFTSAGQTAPFKTGVLASRPATCQTGTWYIATDQTDIQRLNECTSTNTWTQHGTSGLHIAGTAVFTNQITANGLILAGAGFRLSGNSGDLELQNNAATSLIPNSAVGTTCNELVKLDGAGKAVVTSGGELNGVVGVAVSGCSTSGSVQVSQSGQERIIFNVASPVAGNFAGISSTAGLASDAGSAPTSGQPIGQILINPDGSAPSTCNVAPGCWVQLNTGSPIGSSVAGNAVVQNPASTAANTIQPTSSTAIAVKVIQPSSGSVAVAQVTASNGSTNYWQVDSTGKSIFGSGAGGDVTMGREFLTLYGDFLDQVTDPAAPAASHITLYNKAGVLCQRVSGGTVTCGLGGGTGASLTPAADQVFNISATFNQSVNRFETIKFCDQFASLQACHDDLGSTGGLLVVPQGTMTSCGTTITKNNVHIMGMGKNASVLQCTTAATPILIITGTSAYVEGLTIQHATNQPTCAGGAGSTTCGEGIQFIGTDRFLLTHNQFKNNYNAVYVDNCTRCLIDDNLMERSVNDGELDFYTTTTMQIQHSHNAYLQNGGIGLHMLNTSGAVGTCGDSENNRMYGNNGKGLSVDATGAGSKIDDCRFKGTIFSTNNDDNAYFNNGARKLQFEDNFSEQAGASEFTGVAYGTTISPGVGVASFTGYGLNLTSSCDPTTPPLVTGNVLWNNSFSGIYAGCARTSMIGNSAHGNGRAESANAYQRAGITIRADNAAVTGGEHDGDSGCTAGATCQKYGVEISNSADTPTISAIQCHTNLTACILATTQPTNGFKVKLGNGQDIYNTGAPGGACTNGDVYHRTDAGNFDTVYGCKNAAWVAMTSTGGTVTNTGGSLTNNQLMFGAGGNDSKVGNLTGDVTTAGGTATAIAANAVTAAKSATVLTRRVCPLVLGANNGTGLVAGDLGPQSRQCLIPYAATIVEVNVSADAGTPNVIVGRNRAGSIVNIVSSALATAGSGGIACSNTGGTTGLDGATTCSATLQNTGLNAGDYLELVSGAASTAKEMSIFVVFTVN